MYTSYSNLKRMQKACHFEKKKTCIYSYNMKTDIFPITIHIANDLSIRHFAHIIAMLLFLHNRSSNFQAALRNECMNHLSIIWCADKKSREGISWSSIKMKTYLKCIEEVRENGELKRSNNMVYWPRRRHSLSDNVKDSINSSQYGIKYRI